MNEEFQRIATELSDLQEQIFCNELPSILLNLSPHSLSQQYSQLLINGIVNVQRVQFINDIAKNIANVKHQNHSLKIQNTQLKNLVKNQSFQTVRIEQTIKNMIHEKNCLQLQLEQYKTKQHSLQSLTKSNNIQLKVKELIRQNQMLKVSLQQQDKVIEVQTLQIKAYIDKEIYYVSQIGSLQNENKLYNNDLTNSMNEINYLKQSNNKLIETETLKQKQLQQTIKSLQKQIQQNINQLLKQRQLKLKQQQLKIQAIKQNQTLLLEIQQQINKVTNMQQLNISLQISLEHIKNQLAINKEQQKQMLLQYHSSQEAVIMLNNRIKSMEQSEQQMLIKINKQNQIKEEMLRNEILTLTGQFMNQQKKYAKLFEESTALKDKINEQTENKRLAYEKLSEDKIKKINQQLTNIRQIKDRQAQQYSKLINELSTQIEKLKKQLYLQYHQKYFPTAPDTSDYPSDIQQLFGKASDKTDTRFIIQVMKIKIGIQSLKKQNIELKNLFVSILDSTKKWLFKQMNKLVGYLLESKGECEVCQHWEKYENRKKNVMQAKVEEIKSTKDIKTLNQKSKIIKEQNQKFGNRIQQIIRN